MKYDVSNWVFNRDGKPGVVIARNEDGTATAQTSGKKYDEARAVGFINGLKGSNREAFNTIIREVRQEQYPERRVEILKDRIDHLKSDPKNRVLKRYLESEMAFIMNSEGVHPPTFEFDESDI